MPTSSASKSDSAGRFTPEAITVNNDQTAKKWTADDAILYALGVGAGCKDPDFTTENSKESTLQTIPSYAVVLGAATGVDFDSSVVDLRMIVHGSQSFHLQKTLPSTGEVQVSSRLKNVYDKGKGALAIVETTGTSPDGDTTYFTNEAGIFIRGAGGWGGEAGPAVEKGSTPDRPADHQVTFTTREDQALLYRLCGDKNPLHSDPAVAKAVGFEKPILHGLCTYGFTCRGLIEATCRDAPERLIGMRGRFTAPVYPGEALTVRVWETDNQLQFQTVAESGAVVIDGGDAQLR